MAKARTLVGLDVHASRRVDGPACPNWVRLPAETAGGRTQFATISGNAQIRAFVANYVRLGPVSGP